ncbi:MAG TPA: DNA polymerase III subunit alpha [Desulfobacteria bacterium]|nr:DNA polymerase III subunit alpha [Desulfobacteria bacterium]
MNTAPFVHLHVHSPFSFLDGGSTLEKLVGQAVAYGMPALALTDHNNLCGAVKFQQLAEEKGIKPIIGTELTLAGDHHLTLLAQNPTGYANLCRLLTKAHLNNERRKPQAALADLAAHSEGLIALSGCRKGEIPALLLHRRYREALAAAERYLDIFGKERFFLEIQADLLPGFSGLLKGLGELAEHLGIELTATNNVHFAGKEDFPVHDLLTCVRTLTGVTEVHPERRLNAENYLKSPQKMAQTLRRCPQALANTLKIAAACSPALSLNQPLFPLFPLPRGQTAPELLRHLAYQGAESRYGLLTQAVRERLEHELGIINQLGFADYFLLVWDVARYAKNQGIRFAGRGSAADSVVAYCLYITEVDSLARGLLFERFMSLERAQKPDIDIDFDSRYRDKVANYIYQKYGADKVATVCTYNTFQARAAIRDIGKALDFPAEEIDRIAKKMPWLHADDIEAALAKFPELRESGLPWPKYAQLFAICAKIAGFPRFIGTHLGGVVVCREPLTNVTPLQEAAKGVVVTQFDKDYIEDLGLVKLDLLSLRTMAAIDGSLVNIRSQGKKVDYEQIPLDDKQTYARINQGETIGIFQLESPAQRALQSRLNASKLEDIVASVALIRPGPIKGNMVEPFIARRHGLEPVTYLHPQLEPILAKTYGVVLFQEQVLEIAQAIAGFSPGEADRLRRVMSHARSRQDMEKIGEEFIKKSILNGVEREVAETIFSYMAGYASYGFCEAHAAAFATTAFKTAYLVEHYPAEFFAAVLSQQPMGFYAPHTICVELRRRGVAILSPDVNASGKDFSVEQGRVRVSLRQVKNMREEELDRIIAARRIKPYASFRDFCRRSGVSKEVLESLVLCGACDSLHPNRRQLFWAIRSELAGRPNGASESSGKAQQGNKALRTDKAPLSLNASANLSFGFESEEVYPDIPDYTPEEKLLNEYAILGITVREHLVSFWRRHYGLTGITTSRELSRLADGENVRVGGIVIRPHRPPTKSGKTVVFFSLEDEFGLVDVTMFESIYQQYGGLLFGGKCPPLAVSGSVQRRGNGLSVTAWKVEELRRYFTNR